MLRKLKQRLALGNRLYGRGQDLDDYGYYSMWYQVILEGDVEHFFMSGWFDPMKAKVQSVAKITHYVKGDNLFAQTDTIAKSQTYESWNHIKVAKSNDAANERSVLSTGNKYREGDKNRFELFHLNGIGGINKDSSGSNKGNPYKSKGTIDQTGYDDIFIDWQTDMAKMTTEDLDLGIKNAKSDVSKGWTHFLTDSGTTNLTGETNLQRRIHGTINFEKNAEGKFPYPVRDADYLWKNTAAYNEMVNKQKQADPNVFKGMTKEEIIAHISRITTTPSGKRRIRIGFPTARAGLTAQRAIRLPRSRAIGATTTAARRKDKAFGA